MSALGHAKTNTSTSASIKPSTQKTPVHARPVSSVKSNKKSSSDNTETEIELNRVKEALSDIEKERDFYLWKLRDIDTLCQQYESENLPAIKKIIDILYSTMVNFVNLFFK